MAFDAIARADGSSLEFAVLDGDATLFDPRAVAAIVANVVNAGLPEVARDRNGVCFRTDLRYAGGRVGVIVKAARPGPQRSNPDDTFGWEAHVLGALPRLGIRSAPILIARVAAAGRHFLLTSELPGGHPHARAHPFSPQHFDAVLDELYALDASGLMHYDLKPGNVLVDGDRASFIDYEFARFGEAQGRGGHAASFYADFNVASNPFAPGRSNVANFEFRTLHHYLADLEATAHGGSNDVLIAWLAAKSRHHERVALHWAHAPPDDPRLTESNRTTSGPSARRHAAVAHERQLARLLARPAACTVRVERAVMAVRCAVFERHEEQSHRWRTIAVDALREGRGNGELPPGYCDAMARVLTLVGRSTHPGTVPQRQGATSRRSSVAASIRSPIRPTWWTS